MENKMEITEDAYYYLCAFIHLSNVEDTFKIGDLINGIIKVTKISDGTEGFIYKTNDEKWFIDHNGTNTYFAQS